MRVFDDGSIVGSIGGGTFEKQVIEDALSRIHDGSPKLYEHHLLHEHNMCCGGTIKVFIEPDEPPSRLIIFGAGHVGQALATLGVQAGFVVHVYDDRPEFIQQINNEYIATHCMDFANAVDDVFYDERTFIVILTYRHDIDRTLLRHTIGMPSGYLGMIGSRRKILITKKMMLQEGVASEAALDAVDMPIGLDISAETPFEIAVSIIAGLISAKNRHLRTETSPLTEIETCIPKQP